MKKHGKIILFSLLGLFGGIVLAFGVMKARDCAASLVVEKVVEKETDWRKQYETVVIFSRTVGANLQDFGWAKRKDGVWVEVDPQGTPTGKELPLQKLSPLILRE